jgi:hypothetical protein
MAGLSKRIWILLIAFGAIPPFAHAAEPPPPVHYDIGLDVKQHEAEALTVRASVQAGDDGIVDFDAPAQAPVEVNAGKGSLDTSVPGRWRVTAAPRSDVVLVWRSPKPTPLAGNVGAIWEHVVSHDDAVVVAAKTFLAIPRGDDSRRVTSTAVVPAGWSVANDIGSGAGTVHDLTYSNFLAARDLQSASREVWPGTMIRVNVLRSENQHPDAMAAIIADTLVRFGKRHEAPETFSVNVLTHDIKDAMASSWNRSAATLLVPRNSPSSLPLLGLVGNFAIGDVAPADAGNAWFIAGVGTYRLATHLNDTGAIDNVALAMHLDQTATAYGNSPLRRAPNASVITDYDRIRDMHDLAATRGELFAWLVDGQMREATQGRKRLTDALKRMDVHATEPGPALIAAVAAEGGGDIAPLYQRYIVDGELLQLPRTALGPHYTIGTVAAPDGWQVQHVYAKQRAPSPP